jgi:hypothetical protein
MLIVAINIHDIDHIKLLSHRPGDGLGGFREILPALAKSPAKSKQLMENGLASRWEIVITSWSE